MSMQQKLMNAQKDACIRERDRVMRICFHITRKLREDFNKKLMSAAEKHLADVKLHMAEAILGAIQIKVMSGADPDAKETTPIDRPDADAVGPPQGDPDAAG